MRDPDLLREAADMERKQAREHGHWCEICRRPFGIRQTFRRINTRVVCPTCYDGHANCKPEYCIVHCPMSLRAPNDWRALARPLQ
jgi:hypothetical protein